MKVKVISCEIFRWILEEENADYDVVYLDIAMHNQPHELHQRLQKEIDHSQEYDVILLLYGICGNASIDLYSPMTDMYIFRSHDCSSVLLGKKENRLQEPWSCLPLSKGHLLQHHEYQLWCDQYGKEMADYLAQQLHVDHIFYISFQKKQDAEAIDLLQQQGYHIKQILHGTKQVISALWQQKPHEMILHVPKNHKIIGIYDEEDIISVKRMV